MGDARGELLVCFRLFFSDFRGELLACFRPFFLDFCGDLVACFRLFFLDCSRCFLSDAIRVPSGFNVSFRLAIVCALEVAFCFDASSAALSSSEE